MGVHPARQAVQGAAIDGTIGDDYDNAVIESFWARMQTELLDRKQWSTRMELANALFEYLEIPCVSASGEAGGSTESLS